MIEKAVSLVKDYLADRIDKEPTLFVVWQAQILDNFKCAISTTLPYGMFFQLTYDSERERWYMDIYRKVENREVSDG